MQELRLVLIILGAVAIAALLLHGLWTSRKEKPAKFGEKPIGKLKEKDDAGFDQDGIGSVRVIKTSSPEKAKSERKEPELSFGDKPEIDPLFANDTSASEKAGNLDSDIELPSISAKDTETDVEDKTPAEVDNVVEAEVAHSVAETPAEPVPAPEPDIAAYEDEKEEVVDAPKEPEQQVLILNVLAGGSKEFDGEELINCLEQHGMIFGEMEIYHRHADLAGNGQVLFSAANMFNPGSFPLATIHQFTTPGITFFMTLPCYGEAEQNFKLMLQTAQQVADQLGGLVADDKRNMMTPQRLDGYRDRIKQFHAHV